MKTVKQIIQESAENKRDKELLDLYESLCTRFFEILDVVENTNNEQFKALMYMWLDKKIHYLAEKYRKDT